MADDRKAFSKWIRSDNVIKETANGYRTQCTLYTKLYTRKELYAYFKKEYGS